MTDNDFANQALVITLAAFVIILIAAGAVIYFAIA
jgi:hypothetical protein